jgi:hypothetical protein
MRDEPLARGGGTTAPTQAHWHKVPRLIITPDANAIRKECEEAGVPHWNSNQIRYTPANDARRAHRLEVDQMQLDHPRADVTRVDAERNEALVIKIAGEYQII